MISGARMAINLPTKFRFPGLLYHILGGGARCREADLKGQAYSPLTFSRPRNRNCRKPCAALICPNTGSTVIFRRPYLDLPLAVSSFRCIRSRGDSTFGIRPREEGVFRYSSCCIFPVAIKASMPRSCEVHQIGSAVVSGVGGNLAGHKPQVSHSGFNQGRQLGIVGGLVRNLGGYDDLMGAVNQRLSVVPWMKDLSELSMILESGSVKLRCALSGGGGGS